MSTKLLSSLHDFGRLVQKAGPYVVLEIVLPGGTLFALGLYLYRSGQLRNLSDVRVILRGVLRAAGSAFDQLAYAFQPFGASPGSAGDAERDGLEPLDMLARGR